MWSSTSTDIDRALAAREIQSGWRRKTAYSQTMMKRMIAEVCRNIIFIDDLFAPCTSVCKTNGSKNCASLLFQEERQRARDVNDFEEGLKEMEERELEASAASAPSRRNEHP